MDVEGKWSALSTYWILHNLLSRYQGAYFVVFYLSKTLNVPSRRRSNIPGPDHSTDLLAIDMDMLDVLALAAVEGTEETCIIIAKFLNTVVSEPSLLTTEEVDQFVIINGHTLFKWCPKLV